MKRAALYLRSSKDRSDVSIDAQRRALTELAKNRGLLVAEEFADAVESGKDDNRPGFQSLIRAVRNPARGWSIVLLHDTSRLSRRRVISLIFEEIDCKNNGVTVVYKTLPEVDPLTEIVLKSVMVAWDEYHSISSKQKGLAGMAENVRQGYRAGGRAPRGYQLRKIHTGAVRDGEPVSKSVLELGPDADAVRRFLQARVTGTPAQRAAREAGLDIPAASMVSMEWNALTYAGHTVWNVNAERSGGGYVGGSKRRPRAEWIIQRDTHPALISEADAEALLARLEANGQRFRNQPRSREGALLSGLLVDTAGQRWHSDGGAYRLPRKPKARVVVADAVDDAVIDQVYTDLRSPALLDRLVASTQAALTAGIDDGSLKRSQREMVEVEKRIQRHLDLAEQSTRPEPMLRKIEELEGRRAELAQEVARLERECALAKAATKITTKDVRKLLDELMADRGDDTRGLLVALVDKVVLDPDTLAGEVHYRVGNAPGPKAGVRLASPRGAESIPGFVMRAAVAFRVATGSQRRPA